MVGFGHWAAAVKTVSSIIARHQPVHHGGHPAALHALVSVVMSRTEVLFKKPLTHPAWLSRVGAQLSSLTAGRMLK
jgi:hypothetical protein